jgi:hypothetical protein
MVGSTLAVYSFGLIFVSARTKKRHLSSDHKQLQQFLLLVFMQTAGLFHFLQEFVEDVACPLLTLSSARPFSNGIFRSDGAPASPTPAGRMLERMYCGINSRAQDPELRCLRVLSQFNTTDIETGLSDTMSLVMRCFNVKDNFQRLVENVLRQKKDVVQVVTTKTIRPLLRKPGNRSRAEKNSAEVYGELEHLETCGEFSDNDQFIHPEASLLHLRPTHTTGNMQIPAPLSHRHFEQNL